MGMVTKDSSSRETKSKPFENRLDDDEAFDAMGRVETWLFKKMRAQSVKMLALAFVTIS